MVGLSILRTRRTLVIPIKENNHSGYRLGRTVYPLSTIFEPQDAVHAACIFGYNPGVNIAALIGAPAYKTSTPFHTASEAIPRPIRLAAHITHLRKSDGDNLILAITDAVKDCHPKGIVFVLEKLGKVFPLFCVKAVCRTRDPLRIARDLGIEVMYYPFNEQRGAYKVLMRNRFIFIKNDLHPVMENIVLLHELGHDALHREEATKVGGFKEFEIFNMRDNRMEYEANLFAAQISLSDEDFLELAERGYDTQQIARTLNSDINLFALKADTLISQGYRLRQQEHCNDFLRYNK